jgi:hypothetical protein
VGFKKLQLPHCVWKNSPIQQPVNFTSVHACIVLGRGVHWQYAKAPNPVNPASEPGPMHLRPDSQILSGCTG